MSLLCMTRSDRQSTRVTPASKRADAAARVRGLGRSIAQTAKDLRTIVVEPRRLVWAAVDKDSFEKLIAKVESLNSFLITLLDSSQLRRLQDSMTTAYLEILQLRTDVVDLAALVKALSPAAGNQQNLPPGADPVSNALSHAVLEEQATQDKKKSYLRHLAEVKMQLTKINELNDNTAAPDLSNFIDTELPLTDFQFEEGTHKATNLQKRTWATYHGRSVWIEWKDIPEGSAIRPDDAQIQWRIRLLTDLLRSVKPDGFRAAPCLGYIKTADPDGATRFGVVFEGPSPTQSKIATLRELLDQTPKPSLSARVALCAVLARFVHSLHAVNWLHKALRADNIIFFSSSGSSDLDAPFVSGFDLSRPSNMDQWTEKPGFEPAKDIYRHPNAQFSQTDGSYRKSYDIYSLGVVMTEIALWKPIEDVVGLENLPEAKPLMLLGIQPRLLQEPFTGNATDADSCLQQIASACGDSLRDIVERCLEMDAKSKPESDTPMGLQKATELDLVKKLEHIAEAI
ncbi:hypothetical protein B5807_03136 [Epicoccum nigrum]|uniref:Protein kinase domain-containing protein n=1 Tax=Epicoccum nigrum TaxID=105696 RepID=A0A1Y2M781_EPING|nr:hypothetical protein B5807_03136 [Epicoccum nigrum]